MKFWDIIKDIWKVWNIFKGVGLSAQDKKSISDWSSVALKLVQDMDRTSLTNESKKNEAFKALKEAALAKGITLNESMLNFLIEHAVLVMRNFTKK